MSESHATFVEKQVLMHAALYHPATRGSQYGKNLTLIYSNYFALHIYTLIVKYYLISLSF